MSLMSIPAKTNENTQKNAKKSTRGAQFLHLACQGAARPLVPLSVTPLVAAAYIARTIYFIYSSLQKCVWLFIQVVTNSCRSHVHQRFMRESFFKNEISENISQKFHDQWKIDWQCSAFNWKGTSWNIDLAGFVDEFDSRHDRIKLHWVDVDMKFWLDGAGICVRIALLVV